MKELVFDVESNGLLDTVTQVWCIAGHSISESEDFMIDKDDLSKESIINLFKGYDRIIGHNIISYDIPLINMMYSVDLFEYFKPYQIYDTYLMSRLSYPDRPLPIGCPTSVRNEATGRLKTIGPHSLEAHGFSLGIKKISIDVWDEYTPEIIQRCLVDVKINTKVYHKLMKELNIL